MSAMPATTQTLAHYMTREYWRAEGFPITTLKHAVTATNNVLTVNLTGLTPEGRTLARHALDAWKSVVNLDFREVTSGGKIVFDDNAPGANTGHTADRSGTIQSAKVVISTDWLARYGTTLDSYSFHTYMHEIGHALGLGHLGTYRANAPFSDARFLTDSWQQSVMSYFNQNENTHIDASYARVVTPMMADVMAIQSLYGAPRGGATAGDTVYGMGGTLKTYLGPLLARPQGLSNATATIYDEGGIDTINFSQDTKAQRVNLNGGAFSDVFGLKGNLAIAIGTVIENYVAGSGGDVITGNAANNVIHGMAGNDIIDGAAGNDVLYGGPGRDVLRGGAGDDILFGERAGGPTEAQGAQVYRLYGAVFDRAPDPGGFANWTDALANGRPYLAAVEGFTLSREFQMRYGATTDQQFVTLLYNNVLDRAPDPTGLANWTGHLTTGRMTRAEVVRGFAESLEHQRKTAAEMKAWMRAQGPDDRLEGGPGSDVLHGGTGADTFVFSRADAGQHRVADLQSWDWLEFRGFGYGGAGQALARMTQVGADVHFADQGTTVVLSQTKLADLTADMFVFA
jgi:Ca2+-binding RTX toxin-like protein